MQFDPAFFIEVAASINICQQILRLEVQDDGIGCRHGQVTAQALMVLRGFFPKIICMQEYGNGRSRQSVTTQGFRPRADVMCNRSLQSLRRFDTCSKTTAADKILSFLWFEVQAITGNSLHLTQRPFDRHTVSPA